MIRRPLVVASIALFALAGAASALGRHLNLVRSDPASSAIVLKAPKAITLWFSQKPNVKLTRVVLVHGKRDTVKTVPAVAADSTGKKVRVGIVPTLQSGKYEVSWRTLSRDGHAVAGKFTFSVDTAKAVSARTRQAR